MSDDDKALVERLRDFVIAEDIDLAADRIEALSAENERLREALWFYANNKNYQYIIGTGCTSVDIDAGDTARAALGETK